MSVDYTQRDTAADLTDALATVTTGMQQLIERVKANGLDHEAEETVVQAIEAFASIPHTGYASMLADAGFEALDGVELRLDATPEQVDHLVSSGALRAYPSKRYGTSFVPVSQIEELKSNQLRPLAEFDITVAVTLLGSGTAA